MNKLGFVILNYNKPIITKACVNSILETYSDEKIIVIVDNGSSNKSYEILHDYFLKNEQIYILRLNNNCGFAAGNNKGIEYLLKKNIKYAIITNNDIIFKPETIKTLFLDIQTNRKAIQIAPMILDIDGKLTTLPSKGSQSLLQFLELKNNNKLQYKQNELKKLEEVYKVPGCCFIADLKKFNTIGLFDEGTFLYMEECIISKSIYQNNYSVMYDPNVSVIHKHEDLIGNKGKQSLFYMENIIKSSIYYWGKYEEVNNIKLFFIWLFFVIKASVKICLGKTEGKGFYTLLKKTMYFLYKEMRKK